ncbi:hypothetical protein Q0Z83_012370 [Actinoplanes sichuanensis]|nr:hypothetical protein Q0Z83_012370 [Actinoplanes sichuanensis]
MVNELVLPADAVNCTLFVPTTLADPAPAAEAGDENRNGEATTASAVAPMADRVRRFTNIR